MGDDFIQFEIIDKTSEFPLFSTLLPEFQYVFVGMIFVVEERRRGSGKVNNSSETEILEPDSDYETWMASVQLDRYEQPLAGYHFSLKDGYEQEEFFAELRSMVEKRIAKKRLEIVNILGQYGNREQVVNDMFFRDAAESIARYLVMASASKDFQVPPHVFPDYEMADLCEYDKLRKYLGTIKNTKNGKKKDSNQGSSPSAFEV